MSALDLPFAIDARGRAATSNGDDHVRDMIRLVLFTAPGERVNRPEFGCGVRNLVFEPASEVLAGATNQLIHGALQRWLAPAIVVEAVSVSVADATLAIDVAWRHRSGSERQVARFVEPVTA